MDATDLEKIRDLTDDYAVQFYTNDDVSFENNGVTATKYFLQTTYNAYSASKTLAQIAAADGRTIDHDEFMCEARDYAEKFLEAACLSIEDEGLHQQCVDENVRHAYETTVQNEANELICNQ